MSLVLNSNDSWQLKESFWAIWYPDINQVLLKPIAWQSRLGSWQVSDISESWNENKEWANINWTIINYLCNKLFSPYMFIWGGSNFWYWTNGIITNSAGTTASYRIWIKWWFLWWEIVGKDLIWRSVIANNNSNKNHVNRIHYAKIRLLHLDWTFTDIWELWNPTSAVAPDFFDNNIFYYNGNNYTACAVKLLHTTTNWVVAQEWDWVVADVYVEASLSVVFWNDGASQNNCYTYQSYTSILEDTWIVPNPIQVSVE